MFSRVLIANRGEIAVRIARTLRWLGVESVAVYSDADVGAAHVRSADRALRIGPAAPAESYLSVERIVEAALASGAEAVHPGYGFLSERPELPRACAEAGIAFVGPGPEAMALLGDKVAAKAAAEAAGVPALPGLSGPDPGRLSPTGLQTSGGLSDGEIGAWVETAELPVLLKAAAGGGGRGMRIVRAPGELEEALAAARREAGAAFGDERLLVERYLEGSRHIEVQLIADAHGNCIHLGERECSLQRRHQKVIEEAPSPVVDPALRARMGGAAVALAREAGYVNAGTVELIVDREDRESFYFLEMNARLQVEHPVTEAVTGLDLVELQLRVAAGEELPLAQDEVELRGWAVEARVYAEEPARGFLPSTGTVVAYREPAAALGPGEAAGRGAARIDSGVQLGSVVGADYDPMLAKVVGAGGDRRAALAALDGALGQLVLLGPGTNVAYLRALLGRPEVRAGELDTGLIERLGEEVAPPPMAPEVPAVALALLLGASRPGDAERGEGPRRATGAQQPTDPWRATDPQQPTDPRQPTDPWQATDAWRLGGRGWTRATLTGPNGPVESAIFPTIRGKRQTRWEWEAGDSAGAFELDGDRLTVDGVTRILCVELEPGAVWILDGRAEPVRFALADEDREHGAAAAHGGSLEAPMPGTVIAVRRGPGEEVAAGEVLVVVESMKMELAVQSPAAGTVAEVLVAAGEQVERGQTLVLMGEDGAGERGSTAGDPSGAAA